MNVQVPQEDLDNVEKARVQLFELAKQMGWDQDPATLMSILTISQPLWHVSHRRYEEVA
jgi:hypothetical protein